ncbi:MAG TPA: DISARM system helicase DrmA, partial [Anaerolineae bacterium]|nr:DISARM system helicase DrmA [Anaerolineae bacterium]
MLLDMVLKDLLGPAGGDQEIVEEEYVRGRYILGLLAPKGQSALPDEDDEIAEAGEDTEEGKAEPVTPHATRMLPSSIGMSFTVSRDATAIQVTARYGRYERRTREQVGLETEGKSVWQRIRVEGTSVPIPLRVGRIEPWAIDENYPQVFVEGLIRQIDHEWIVTLYLVNAQSEPQRNKDSAWVFQPELIVESPDGTPIFTKYLRLRDRMKANDEDETMRMLYRKQVEFGVGHGVAIHADLAPDSFERAVRLATRVVPTYELPQTTPPTSGEIPALAQACLDMKRLAELRDDEFSAALNPVADAYTDWIQTQRARVTNPSADLEPYLLYARQNLDKCETALRRISAGIDLLARDGRAAEAFRFANRAMYLQRVHSLHAQAKRQEQESTLEDFDEPKNYTWRPFQLAFILLNLPGLTDPHHADRSASHQAIADVLWFPTGGGKTEAYLGLTAYTLGLRRLQGEAGGLDATRGVAVLMRYTLRLLTLQQFQRATALICACESIRRENVDKWGDEPFRIGLWVGQRSTPNWTDDAAQAIQEAHGSAPRATAIGGRGTPHQLTNCPWCGSPIVGGRDIVVERYNEGRGRTLIFCGNPIGDACLYTRKSAPNEGLPVLVVDEEIYRRLPALLIATVDKFAQMPWRGQVKMLFGRVDASCPRHGYCSPDLDCPQSHPKRGRLERVTKQRIKPFRPPDLIIQDELHLINGPLGTLVGLYEIAVDRLCSWELDGKRVRPKVIASSATIRQSQRQVHDLYLRRVEIFPPSSLDVEDNFFSRQRVPSSEFPGRLYLGICAPGERSKAVLIRVYVAFLAAAWTLYRYYPYDADPWLTLVGYFNAIRELGGTRRSVEDTVRARLPRMDRRGFAKRYLGTYSIEELTSRKGATDIPNILDRLETVFDPQKEKQSSASNKKPLDILLATNMISVGVDVPRLGLMVVAGQPKYTAEYIQATSRIGRSKPGLVCTVYNWARPRDLSHYER